MGAKSYNWREYGPKITDRTIIIVLKYKKNERKNDVDFSNEVKCGWFSIWNCSGSELLDIDI